MGTGPLIGRSFWAFVCSEGDVHGSGEEWRLGGRASVYGVG